MRFILNFTVLEEKSEASISSCIPPSSSSRMVALVRNSGYGNPQMNEGAPMQPATVAVVDGEKGGAVSSTLGRSRCAGATSRPGAGRRSALADRRRCALLCGRRAVPFLRRRRAPAL